jgi:signal transduction histidine kinase
LVLGLAAVGGHYLIRRAVRPVEEAFQRERRFTGAASHELRTPLTALRGEIDVALRHPRSASEYQEALLRMAALVARMTGLVEGLLVLARADAGHLLSEVSEVSVAALEATLREVTRQLPHQQRLAVTCTAPQTMKVLGDSLLLAIAVRNLIENSLCYAPQGSVHLRISSPAGDVLELSVEDEGPGVPPEVLAAFDANAPPNGVARQTRANGTGLGLSITRAVVESHGGELCLKNRLQSGCVAVIRLRSVLAATP